MMGHKERAFGPLPPMRLEDLGPQITSSTTWRGRSIWTSSANWVRFHPPVVPHCGMNKVWKPGSDAEDHHRGEHEHQSDDGDPFPLRCPPS